MTALIVGLVAAFVSIQARPAPRTLDGALGRLGATEALESTRRIEVATGSERIAARAVQRWSRMGLEVVVTDPAEAGGRVDAAELGARIVVVDAAEGGSSDTWRSAADALTRSGLVIGADRWSHPAGWSRAPLGCAAAVTVRERGVPTTYVRCAGSGIEARRLAGEVVDRLSLGLPPLAPTFVVWNAGRRELTVPLTSSGAPITSRAEVHAYDPDDSVSTASPAARVAKRVRDLRRALAERGVDAPELSRIAGQRGASDRALDGPVHAAGWYDVARGRLVVVRDVPASLDDALYDYVETVLVDRHGGSIEPWMLDGLVRSHVGNAIVEDEAFSRGLGIPAFDQVLGATPRSWLALGASRAEVTSALRSMRTRGAESRWGDPLTVDERPVLEARWTGRGPAAHPPGVRPRLRELAAVPVLRIAGTPRDVRRRLASASFRGELEAIATRGYGAVAFEVNVPVAPPAVTLERDRNPLSLEGWGRHVTLEGDGALLLAAAAAHASGLAVVVWPRLVTGPSGALGERQIHGTPERYARYAERAALALEGVAWLAERAEAEAVVMCEPESMPLPRVLVSATASDGRRAGYDRLLEARAAGRKLARRALAPFRGQLLAIANGRGGVEHVAAEIASNPDSVFLESDDHPAVGLIVQSGVRAGAREREITGNVANVRAAGEQAEIAGLWLARDVRRGAEASAPTFEDDGLVLVTD